MGVSSHAYTSPQKCHPNKQVYCDFLKRRGKRQWGISSNDLEKAGQKNNSKEQEQNSLLYFFYNIQDFTAHSCLLQIWQMAVCPRGEKSFSPGQTEYNELCISGMLLR
jgi:hypothetical protein